MADESKDGGVASKALINDPATAVTEMIDGFLLMNPQLTRLDGFEKDIKVILRRDWDSAKADSTVALISGGGSGHEPAHAGYVGEGMLTAAVCGNVYASPSVAAVLAAIRAVGGAKGVLLIIKNYTGDRLHFGIAAEQAKTEGIHVETVFVADDVAVDTGKITGRRGIAGTVFVHKIAGAAAAAGQSLAEVAAVARAVADDVRSMGIATSVCTVPGQKRSDRLDGNVIEIGLGIHGEPGTSRSKPLSANGVADLLVETVLADAPWAKAGVKAAVLVNNLGNSTAMEVSIVVGRVVAQLAAKGVMVERLMAGPYMTALDMSGVSLSLLPLSDSRLALLDAATPVAAWPASAKVALARDLKPLSSKDAESKAFVRPSELSDNAKEFERIISVACNALIAAEPKLTELDTKVGDGDCGFTLKAAAQAILADLSAHYPLNSAVETLEALGETIKTKCAGSSGAFYHIMCNAAEASLRTATDEWSIAAAVSAFKAGVDAIVLYGNAKPGSCTMVDALVPAAEAMGAVAAGGADGAGVLAAGARAAREGADSTAAMAFAAGRASYVEADVSAGVVDAGAEAVASWLAGAAAGAQVAT